MQKIFPFTFVWKIRLDDLLRLLEQGGFVDEAGIAHHDIKPAVFLTVKSTIFWTSAFFPTSA